MVKTLPSNSGSASSIPSRGAKILHALKPKNQSIKQKQYYDKFDKDFLKNGPHQRKVFKSGGVGLGGLGDRQGNGTQLQYSCLENPMDGGAWWATVHGVAKSR